MANQPTIINAGGPVYITNIFTTAPQNHPQSAGSTYGAQAAQLGPEDKDNMNTGEYCMDQPPNAAFMFQGVPWEDHQIVPCKCGTPRERTARPADTTWTPVKPLDVPGSPEFTNGPQAVDDDESCDMALTPTAAEFDAPTPTWEFDCLTRSLGRAETPPADTPMRLFEASLPMGDPVEAAAQVNLFEDTPQEEPEESEAQAPVPTPGTEISHLDTEFPTCPEQDFRVLDEDCMRGAPPTPGADMRTPQEQHYPALNPGWGWEPPATPKIWEQVPSSPLDPLLFDREAFAAALQDSIPEGTGMDMRDENAGMSPSPFY